MIKVMIIEDEPEIRKLLRKIIEKQDGFEVVSEAADFAGAVTEFTKYRPEAVFADIDLGGPSGESGLECAKVMTAIDPKLKVIFATAHSEYMANAFEIYAFDYIVKPFDVERINRTLKRIKAQTEEDRTASDNMEIHLADTAGEASGRLMIKGRERTDFVDIDEIIFAERVESATEILTRSDVFRTSIALGELEERLTGPKFIRCHKSYIINTDLITKIEPYGRWTYFVNFKGTDKTALITAAKYDELKEMFGR